MNEKGKIQNQKDEAGGWWILDTRCFKGPIRMSFARNFGFIRLNPTGSDRSIFSKANRGRICDTGFAIYEQFVRMRIAEHMNRLFRAMFLRVIDPRSGGREGLQLLEIQVNPTKSNRQIYDLRMVAGTSCPRSGSGRTVKMREFKLLRIKGRRALSGLVGPLNLKNYLKGPTA